MVTERAVSEPSSLTSSRENEEDDFRIDTASTNSGADYENALVLHGDFKDEAPSFNNISVANSSDVHFGNKSYYQGPVTIKQFLYANGKVQTDKDGDSDDNDGQGSFKREVILDPSIIAAAGLNNPGFLPDANEKNLKEHPPEVPTGSLKGFQKFSKRHMNILVTLLAIFLVSLVILMIVLLVRHSNSETTRSSNKNNGPIVDSDEQETNVPVDAPYLGPNGTFTLPGKLKLMNRLQWLAQPPEGQANNLSVPAPYVIIHHTATEQCASQAQCIFQVRHIQQFHIESNKWWDIGYNFLVGGDGEAYEGRGWTAEGAHLYGYNSKSIGIAFVGTFTKVKPPMRQIIACKQLIELGVEKGYISKNYQLFAARQLQTTQSPGDVLYEDIKTWPHWAITPKT